MTSMNAKYIWCDPTGTGRNPYCMFRKTFHIAGTAGSATLNLFADTAYRLFVNGESAEFGPVRFDPGFPVYDTHDIRRYLKPGKNVIAVLVNFIGHKTFRSIPARGGMIAWGAVETGGGTVSLDTGKGLWKAKKSGAYSGDSPKLSFALNAQELFQQGLEEEGWKDAEFDDGDWPEAVELERQDSWGPLEKRSIPFMSGKNVPIYDVPQLLPLERKEDLYSFSVPLPFPYDTFADARKEYSKMFCFSTWIFSPDDRQVTAGIFYEDLWINGQKIEKFRHPLKALRYNCRLPLKEGWNHLFGMINAYQDILDVYVALPAGSGLKVSADKKPGSPFVFKRTPLLTAKEYEKYLKDKPFPYSPEEGLQELGGWVYTTKDDSARSPCRESSWDNYREAAEVFDPETLQGHTFEKCNYPEGFSVLVDLEYNHLVFPRIRMEGMRNAVIDVLYSDRLQPDGIHIRQQSWVPLGDRILCARDRIDWSPVQPRGMRYMTVTVRDPSGDVKLESLTFRSASYPVEEKGAFKCSDPCLNAIWEMGKRTLAANMEDAYDDCVDRERGMYVLDVLIQYHVNLATFGDQALMKRCMKLYSQSNHPTGMIRAVYPNTGDYLLPNFGLHAVEGFHAYYLNTGDREFIREIWDSLLLNLKRFQRLSDGRADLLMNGDSPAAHGDDADLAGDLTGFSGAGGNSDNSGVNCLYSCFYLLVLKQAHALAEAIGRQEEAQEMQKRIGILGRTIPETFWNEERGCFRDSLSSERYSVHTNLYAVRAGIAAGERLELVKKLLERELKSVFINGYDPSAGIILSTNDGIHLFEGLYGAGLSHTAMGVMRQAWGWFLAKGLKTCAEHFDAGLNASLCHAWSASPTYYLSRYVLGVHYTAAANPDEVEIDVQAPGIDWAEGTYPHPKGGIRVKWHMEGAKRIFDSVEAPEGVGVKIVERTGG